MIEQIEDTSYPYFERVANHYLENNQSDLIQEYLNYHTGDVSRSIVLLKHMTTPLGNNVFKEIYTHKDKQLFKSIMSLLAVDEKHELLSIYTNIANDPLQSVLIDVIIEKSSPSKKRKFSCID